MSQRIRKDYQKEYRENNREYFREKSKQWYAKFGSTQKRRFSEYKSSAKTRGFDFHLSFEDFCKIREQRCFYCGDGVVLNGIDRVDSKLGYSLDNVVPCCGDCNMMKSDMSIHTFIDKCKKIANGTFDQFINQEKE